MQKLNFTEEEIDNGILAPAFDLINQALSGADNATVDMVVQKIKEGAARLNSNEEFNLEKLINAPFTIGETIAAKTPSKKDDLVFQALAFIRGIIFGTAGGGLMGLIKTGQLISKAKKSE